jgi:hypothetical protein
MKYYEKDESIVGRKIANEVILVPIKHNMGDLEFMYTLNEVGGRIWELLDGGTTTNEIVSALTKEYGIETSQAEVDVTEFLEQMKEIGAVVERDERGLA